jgi:opacity protein-like surface antigen
MKFKLLAGAAMAAVFAASGASAQTGWYSAADIGYHWPEGIKADSSVPSANGNPYVWRFNQQDDWTGFIRLGYQVSDHWRVELEGGYLPGNVDSVRGGTNQAVFGLCSENVLRTAAAPNCGSTTGKIEPWSVMTNVIYDILPDSMITPFIGAGLGVQHIELSTDGQFSNVTGIVTAQSGANPAIQNLDVTASSTVFAYQLIGGASWKATDHLKIDATYRFEGGSSGKYQSLGTNALEPGVFQGRYRDSSATIGLR